VQTRARPLAMNTARFDLAQVREQHRKDLVRSTDEPPRARDQLVVRQAGQVTARRRHMRRRSNAFGMKSSEHDSPYTHDFRAPRGRVAELSATTQRADSLAPRNC